MNTTYVSIGCDPLQVTVANGGVAWNPLRKEKCHVILVVDGILGGGHSMYPCFFSATETIQSIRFLAPAKKQLNTKHVFKNYEFQ